MQSVQRRADESERETATATEVLAERVDMNGGFLGGCTVTRYLVIRERNAHAKDTR